MNKVVGLIVAKRVEREFVSPEESLSWAVTDLKGNDRRNVGNALGNIKRALHGKIDELVDRTRVRLCCDWRNRNTPTEDKLEVLKSLGIEHRTVLKLITDTRNDLEHTYLLPALAEVQAYLDITKLWLEKVDRDHSFLPLGFIGLPLTGIATNATGITHYAFDPKAISTVQYFDDEDLVAIDCAGAQKRTPYKNFSWREMLKFETPIAASPGSISCALNRASSAKILQLYLDWLKNPIPGLTKIQ